MHCTNSKAIAIEVFISSISACQNGTESKNPLISDTSAKASASVQAPLKEKVLTAAEQQALTPDVVIQSLKDGNRLSLRPNPLYSRKGHIIRNRF